MSHRTLIGLAVGSGFEAADAAVVRVGGIGLGMSPTVVGTARIVLSKDLGEAARTACRSGEAWPTDASRLIGESLTQAARQSSLAANTDPRSALAVGLLARLPEGRAGADGEYATAAPAEWIAEFSGLTVVTGFRGRDVAAGGSGQFITPAADFLLYRHPSEERLLVHLGSATSILLIPAGCKLTDIIGFEAGPGPRLLDDITRLGTRNRDRCDAGGKRAVQGRCLTPLLDRWRSHPYFHRSLPKAMPRAAFGMNFLTDAFELAREAGGTLNDLLCTATHFISSAVGESVRRFLPPGGTSRRIYVSGGGVRNGFLWKRLTDQFPDHPVDRLDAVGVPAGARSAAAAAVLAGLTLDGVAANLPLLTGAAGGRLIGRIIPGDLRNWSTCTAWMHRQTLDYVGFHRAA